MKRPPYALVPEGTRYRVVVAGETVGRIGRDYGLLSGGPRWHAWDAAGTRVGVYMASGGRSPRAEAIDRVLEGLPLPGSTTTTTPRGQRR